MHGPFAKGRALSACELRRISVLTHHNRQTLRAASTFDCGRAACLPFTHGRRMRIRSPLWYVLAVQRSLPTCLPLQAELLHRIRVGSYADTTTSFPTENR